MGVTKVKAAEVDVSKVGVAEVGVTKLPLKCKKRLNIHWHQFFYFVVDVCT